MKILKLFLSTVVIFVGFDALAALDEQWPILAFESGTVAYIPCMVKGNTKAYFWRRGGTYNKSDHVAANVHGEPDEFANATYGKLTVMENGTLVIYDISPNDDGTYFCRVVTQTSEHYGGVIVYSQASLDSFLSIDQCQLQSSCKMVLEPTSIHRLTCIASFVSSLIDVRWTDDNGTIVESSYKKYKNADGSYNISRRAEIVYNIPALLFCEAFGLGLTGEYIHIQLETVQEPESQRENFFVAFLVTLILSIIIIITISAVCKRFTSKGHHEKGADEEKIRLEDEKVTELEEKVKAMQEENATLIETNKTLESDKTALIGKNEVLESEKTDLIRKNKELQLDLEISTRKYRAITFESKNKQKVFLRLKPGDGKSNALSSGIAEDTLQKWRNSYNFTDIFPHDATQETVFADIQIKDLVQYSVDGGKSCVFVFGAPSSGRKYTMKGKEKTSSIHSTSGLIPRAVHKLFELVDDLKGRAIEVKVTVSRLKSYQTKTGDALTFIELDTLNPEKAFYRVQGLNVEKKVYNVSKREEVLDLLWMEPAQSEREGETETSDILQIYIETLRDSKPISKGTLSMAILSATEATKQFSGHAGHNRKVRPLLEPFLKDEKCDMVIIANIALDASNETLETLQAVTKMKLERTMSPKPKSR